MTSEPLNGAVLVNVADWDGPDDLDPAWPIVNAPRPLFGQRTWEARFRHGIFYAADSEIRGGTFGWKADDAWLVEFITNEQITKRGAAKLAEHGYATLKDADMTAVELAAMMSLPWHEEEEDIHG